MNLLTRLARCFRCLRAWGGQWLVGWRPTPGVLVAEAAIQTPPSTPGTAALATALHALELDARRRRDLCLARLGRRLPRSILAGGLLEADRAPTLALLARWQGGAMPASQPARALWLVHPEPDHDVAGMPCLAKASTRRDHIFDIAME